MKKRLTLCADDYSINADVCKAILHLAEAQSISAISSLSSLPLWNSTAADLRQYADSLDLGLHFNLTEGYSAALKKSSITNVDGKFIGLKKLSLKAWLGLVNPLDVAVELENQIELYSDKMHRLPEFIDGHQHIHQLPIIQNVLVKIYDKILRKQNSYIRLAMQHGFKNMKARIISCNGGFSFRKILAAKKIPHNLSFSGVYNFSQAKSFPEHFRKFLKNTADGGVIMCHPGLSGHRRYEYNYLTSEQFKLDSDHHQIEWLRFQKI